MSLSRYLRALSVLLAWPILSTSWAVAGQIDAQNFQTEVTVQVLPFAQIEVLGTPLLYLRIPPAKSTVPASGVTFKVTGNANATVTGEPSDFVIIPNTDLYLNEYMGRAVLNGNSVGYRLRVDFPVSGITNSPPGNASLPGYEAGPTLPLSVNLALSGGVRNGRVHMEASPDWTPSGGLPLPGVYVGEVILTVSAF